MEIQKPYLKRCKSTLPWRNGVFLQFVRAFLRANFSEISVDLESEFIYTPREIGFEKQRQIQKQNFKSAINT